jgi:hypothetical protein
MKIRNQVLLRLPWLFSACTIIGVPLGLYLSGDALKVLSKLTLILIGVGCIAALNLWFFVSLRQTTRDQKRVPAERAANPKP